MNKYTAPSDRDYEDWVNGPHPQDAPSWRNCFQCGGEFEEVVEGHYAVLAICERCARANHAREEQLMAASRVTRLHLAAQVDPALVVDVDLDRYQRDILVCPSVDQALRYRAELSDLRATIERLEALALERADRLCRERD